MSPLSWCKVSNVEVGLSSAWAMATLIAALMNTKLGLQHLLSPSFLQTWAFWAASFGSMSNLSGSDHIASLTDDQTCSEVSNYSSYSRNYGLVKELSDCAGMNALYFDVDITDIVRSRWFSTMNRTQWTMSGLLQGHLTWSFGTLHKHLIYLAHTYKGPKSLFPIILSLQLAGQAKLSLCRRERSRKEIDGNLPHITGLRWCREGFVIKCITSNSSVLLSTTNLTDLVDLLLADVIWIKFRWNK